MACDNMIFGKCFEEIWYRPAPGGADQIHTNNRQKGKAKTMYRILLVDDEILVRDAIKENIDWKSMDCELVGDCENGKQAADFVKTHPVDIVLTDILMPYMDGMELSHFLHDNYPEIVIVIFSGFGEFEYAKKAIQYNVSEYMLKPVTAMELREVIGKMKEKVDQQRKEKEKLESLTKTSQDYHKNALVIRSKAIEALVGCTRDVQKSLDELAKMGIYMDSSSYRVAVFDMDLFSEIHEIDMEKRQESALMAFVLFNVADEIVTGRGAGIAYQEGNNRVCILFMGDHCRGFSQETHEICEEIQNKVKEVIGIEVSAGIGGWVKNPEELIHSHEQAENAIGLRYLLGGNLLIDTEEQKEERSLSLQQSLNEMTNGIRNGNLQAVNHALSDMKEKIKNARADKSQACVCAGDDGHGTHGHIAAVPRQTGAETDRQQALGGEHHKGGDAQRHHRKDDIALRAQIVPAQAQEGLFAGEEAQDPHRAHSLTEHRGNGRAPHAKPEPEDEDGVKDNVDDRTDHGGEHTGFGKALRGNEGVHAQHQQHEHRAQKVDTAVAQGIRQGGIAGTKQPKQHRRPGIEADGKHHRQE